MSQHARPSRYLQRFIAHHGFVLERVHRYKFVRDKRRLSRVSKTIDYNALMHGALRRVMAQVLEDVAVEGLPGSHHIR